MADPLTTFDVITVTAIIVSMAGVCGVLWKAFTSQITELKKDREADKAALVDLVTRVRSLEEKRLEEVKDYASKLEAMNRQQMTVFSRAINAIQDITKIVAGWAQRPCQARDSAGRPLHPTTLPDVDTEVLLRNEEKVKQHQQEESSAP